MFPLQSAVLRTLVYANIFHYPLTLKEIHRWLIISLTKSTPQPSLQKIQKTLQTLLQVKKSYQYYYLKKYPSFIKIRQNHTHYSALKLKLAQKIANFLKKIPTIKAVLVTGNLAMKNAKKEDDIDLLIISQKNSLWVTRLLLIVALEFAGRRRRPRDRGVVNKICPNILLDETSLLLPLKDRNLFTAHELLQARPLFDKENTYFQFISQNSWVRRILPNAYQSTINHLTIQPFNRLFAKIKDLFGFLLLPLNLFAFILQFLYMFPRRTQEKVSLHYAYFHPHPKKNQIFKKYKKRLTNLGLHS